MKSTRSIKRASSALVLLALLLNACGDKEDAKTQVGRLKAELRSKKHELAAAKQADTGMEKYSTAVEKSDDAYRLYIGPEGVKNLFEQFGGYAVPANSLHKDIRGAVEVTAIKDVKFMPGNRASLSALFKGKSLQYVGKQKQFKSHIQKVLDGIKAGMWADLQASVKFQEEKGRFIIYFTCTDVKLLKNSDSTYENMLKDGMNKKALKQAVRVYTKDLAAGEATLKPAGVLTTGNHLIVSYARK